MDKNHKHNPIWGKIGKGAGALSLVLAAALTLFPLGGEDAFAAVSAQIDSINVSKTDSGEIVRPESTRLIPLGHTTGIKLFSEGAMVVGFAPVDASSQSSPAEKAGLRLGDLIIKVNETPVDSNESMAQAVENSQGEELTIHFKRGEEEKTLPVKPVKDEASGAYRIGAFVRDSLAGIGTITFVDPENGAFGALGHGVADQDTGELMPIGGGSLMPSQVAGVEKGEVGSPGELVGEYDLNHDQGVLYQNTHSGIYGKITDSSLYEGRQALETSPRSQVKEGKAQIIANVEGDHVSYYDVEILKVYPDDEDESNRNMMIQVTDKELLRKTGGIVQGMSGSPIVQNGKLIGAVTHVLVNDPTRGYGIFIENMLDTAYSLQ